MVKLDSVVDKCNVILESCVCVCICIYCSSKVPLYDSYMYLGGREGEGEREPVLLVVNFAALKCPLID